MAKHVWKVGDVTITVEAPDGVPVRGASARIVPAEDAQFNAAGDAVGGFADAHFPAEAKPWVQEVTIYPRREDGTMDTACCVRIEEPLNVREQTATSAPPPAHPFFASVQARAERQTAEAQRGESS